MNTELVMKTATGVVVEKVLGKKFSNGREAFIISNGDYHDVMIALTNDIVSSDIVAKQMAKGLKDMMSNCERWYVKGRFSDGTCTYDIVTNETVLLDYCPSEAGGSILDQRYHNNDNTDHMLIAAAYNDYNDDRRNAEEELFNWPDDWDLMDL